MADPEGFMRARRGGVWWLQPAPIWGVNRATRKRVAKAVRSGEHLSDQEEAIADGRPGIGRRPPDLTVTTTGNGAAGALLGAQLLRGGVGFL